MPARYPYTPPADKWHDVPYSAGLFTASAGVWTVEAADLTCYRYIRIGFKAYLFNIFIQNSSVSVACLELRVGLPNGWISSGASPAIPLLHSDAGVKGESFFYVPPGIGHIKIEKWNPSGNWSVAANNTNVFGSVAIEIA